MSLTQYVDRAGSSTPVESSAGAKLKKIEKGTRPVLILATQRHTTESVGPVYTRQQASKSFAIKYRHIRSYGKPWSQM